MPRLPEPYAGRLSRVPEFARRRVEGLPAVEQLARLIEVERHDKAARIAPADLARAYSEWSTKVLKAIPRAELERRIAALRKTAQLGGPADAWAAIAKLREDNPQPRPESWAEAQQRIDAYSRTEKARFGAAMRRHAGRPSASSGGVVERAVRAATAPTRARIAALEGELTRTKARKAAAESGTPSMLYKGGR